MSRAVRFDHYGPIDVLQVVEVPDPEPGPGQARIRVRAAGINPGEGKIRAGLLAERFPAVFPSGQGSDLAGVVDAIGPDVTTVAVGDEVIGFTDDRASHAQQVLVPTEHLTPRPSAVSWEVAGALFVAGTTAYAAVRSVSLGADDTVVISAAAGGVGTLTVQLAGRTGATVIGVAGPANHDWLQAHGVIPVAHGDGLGPRLQEVAPQGINAFIDLYGDGYVELALDLGVASDRINTIADFEAVGRFGVRSEGNGAAASATVLAELAQLIARGELDLPIANTYPLEQVQAAYLELEAGHTRGKIVLLP